MLCSIMTNRSHLRKPRLRNHDDRESKESGERKKTDKTAERERTYTEYIHSLHVPHQNSARLLRRS